MSLSIMSSWSGEKRCNGYTRAAPGVVVFTEPSAARVHANASVGPRITASPRIFTAALSGVSTTGLGISLPPDRQGAAAPTRRCPQTHCPHPQRALTDIVLSQVAIALPGPPHAADYTVTISRRARYATPDRLLRLPISPSMRDRPWQACRSGTGSTQPPAADALRCPGRIRSAARDLPK